MADLNGADPSGADPSGADPSGAELSGEDRFSPSPGWGPAIPSPDVSGARSRSRSGSPNRPVWAPSRPAQYVRGPAQPVWPRDLARLPLSRSLVREPNTTPGDPVADAMYTNAEVIRRFHEHQRAFQRADQSYMVAVHAFQELRHLALCAAGAAERCQIDAEQHSDRVLWRDRETALHRLARTMRVDAVAAERVFGQGATSAHQHGEPQDEQ
jgi:hypothetical protein